MIALFGSQPPLAMLLFHEIKGMGSLGIFKGYEKILTNFSNKVFVQSQQHLIRSRKHDY